ncbi:MAG: heparinase II/III family protein [Candidatus Poribacteria bacterium]|nr:heparinase II/III family protein [Candidatus Poribacteria bacterium]
MFRVFAVLMCAMLAAPAFSAERKRVSLSDGESADGWSLGRVTEDGFTGRGIVADLPSGGSGFVQFDFKHTGVELEPDGLLRFRWRVEGDGFRQLLVKVRNYPLADGMEAVYRVYNSDDGDPPADWTFASIRLATPDYDDWGDSPNRDARYITFRTETAEGANAQLYIDELSTLMPLFRFRVGEAEQSDDGWIVKSELQSLTDDKLQIWLGSEERVASNIWLPGNRALAITHRLPEIAARWDLTSPLQPLSVDVWAQVAGDLSTRRTERVEIVVPFDVASLPPHPRLLLTPQRIEEMKARVEAHDWAKGRYEVLLRRADGLLGDEIKLPPRGSNWYHWYASPENGAPLRRGDEIGEWRWEHIDTVTGKVYLGDPSDPSKDYDGVALSAIHGNWSRAIRDLGVAYQMTGDALYAAKARKILLAYAEKYLEYPLHTTRNEARVGGGRVGPQTLDEAVWLIPVCQGADLIWDTLSEDDRATIADKLLLPAATEVILPHKMGVHNIQCWKNSAVGLVGLLLGHASLIYEAIGNPDRGYYKQMEDGVSPDGAWWEGAWSYHFYTMSSLWALTEAATNCGIDLYGDAFIGMFDAPLQFASPTRTLPPFNDSGEVRLTGGQTSLYELAYARYGDPRYASLLNESDRNNDYALWFGANELPDTSALAVTSANFPTSGYAMLAKGRGEGATWLCLKYGPHGGGHGHPDKLNFVLYAKGAPILIDSGTARYGLPIQGGWYKTTLAHNTLVVDGVSQKAATGKLIAFDGDSETPYVTADAGDIYDSVRFMRTVALVSEDLVLVIDRVESDEPRAFDLATHFRGEWASLPDGGGWSPPDEAGYRYIEDGTSRLVRGTTFTVKVTDALNIATTFADTGSATLITGTGVGDNQADRVPMTLIRRDGTNAAFVWAVALDGSAAELTWDDERRSVTITHRGDEKTLRLDDGGRLTSR